jgi:trimeric autotransporter adhesin
MALITTITQDTHANRPAAGTVGKLYFETDTITLFRDSGTAWISLEGEDRELYMQMVEAVALTGGGNGSPSVYSPVGAHNSGLDISTAKTLTKPTGASKIIIQALTQNVRFTLDGTAPTTTLGFQLVAGGVPFIIEVPGTSIKVIQEAATASLQYQWVS